MAKNPFAIRTPRKASFSNPPGQSKGILDDHAVRKNIATKEGTIEKVPTVDSHIANKKYVDDEIAGVPTTSPGGSDKEVQFNDGGSFAGDADFTWNKTDSQIKLGDGTVTRPAYSFINDFDSGMRLRSSGNLSWSTDGGERMRLSTVVGLKLFQSIKLAIVDAGTVSLPIISIGNDQNTGLFRPSDDKLGIVAGGVEFIRLSETTQDELIMNEAGVDIDFRVESDNNTHMIFVDAENDKSGINTSSPVCEFDINGGFAANLTSQTGTYTALTTDHTIICGSGNESFTVTLPAASGVSGIIYNIKNIGTGTITVDGADSETIDGSTTAVLSSQFGCITIQCDGSNWHIL